MALIIQQTKAPILLANFNYHRLVESFLAGWAGQVGGPVLELNQNSS